MKVFEGTDRHASLLPLESHWQAIRDEYVRVAGRAREWHEQGLHNGLWQTIGLYQFGKWLPESDACPVTTRYLKDIPGLFLAGFSLLHPGCKIHPHKGYSEEVLRSHLGLICPQPSWIEVAGERHHWNAGQVIVFDDTQLHSACNDADHARVVLIADFFK